jgi:plastocyanin
MKKVYNLIYALFFLLISMNANARVQVVEMADFTFTPSSFNIASGDTIAWKLASGTHSVQTLTVPTGSATFDSPVMSVPGETFTFVPEVIGNYTYQCGVHGSMMPGSFMVMSAVGISEPSLGWLSRAYPNPFGDKLNIDIKGIDQIDIFNLIGKRVKTLSTSLADTKIEMDLTGLPAGIYYYNGYKEGKIVATQKIIKAK